MSKDNVHLKDHVSAALTRTPKAPQQRCAQCQYEMQDDFSDPDWLICTNKTCRNRQYKKAN